jgi:8-oxo-dGTP pyrophosphatase MutT (NUDIX family)
LRPQDSFSRLAGRLRPSPDESAHAAVAILVRPTPDDLEFFLVKRAEVPGDPWSGDMAFPGGKKTPGDRSLLDTVAREVREETGIDLKGSSAAGFMKPIFSSVRTTMCVQPIIYRLDEVPDVRLNDELTRYLWVPLTALRDSRSQATVKGWEEPVFKVGGEVVWGLTYTMLEKILEMLED